MTFDPQEAFERELFTMRVVPSMKLDVDDVLRRAAHVSPLRSARTMPMWPAWMGAAACAAAAILGVARTHEPARVSHDAIVDVRGGVSDGLSCRPDAVENVVENVAENVSTDSTSDAMCVADPSSLVCERDVTFSIAKP